jgi:hypothetical protein
MLIDCDQCAMQHTSACDDCVVTFLLGTTPVELTDEQTGAMAHLAEAGLVPRLRLVPVDGPERRVS